jgi:outer membrane protein OmpA-like peptidoglycan-associated protein
MSKVTEIAVYMKQNPSVQVGIDGYADPRAAPTRTTKP